MGEGNCGSVGAGVEEGLRGETGARGVTEAEIGAARILYALQGEGWETINNVVAEEHG